jgi:hypothetical protein
MVAIDGLPEMMMRAALVRFGRLGAAESATLSLI